MPASNTTGQSERTEVASAGNIMRRRRRQLFAYSAPVVIVAVLIVPGAMVMRDMSRKGLCKKSLNLYAQGMSQEDFQPIHAAELWLSVQEPTKAIEKIHYRVTNAPLPENAQLGSGKVIAYCRAQHKSWILPTGRHVLIWHDGKFRITWMSERRFAALGFE